MIDNSSIENNPEVALARARRDQARVDLVRTVVRAPVDGVVAKRQVQVGQRVQAGAPLLTVVPLDRMHVDANFKEVQLESVRIGQKAELARGHLRRQGQLPRHRRGVFRRDGGGFLDDSGAERDRPTGSRWCSGCRCASTSSPPI